MIGTIPMIFMGLAVAINFIVIKWKLEHDRNADAILDAAILFIIAWGFSGSISGLMIGTIASMFVSMYLIVSPPDALIAKFEKKSKSRRQSRNKRNVQQPKES